MDNFRCNLPVCWGTASQHKWNLKDPRDLDAAYRLQFNGGMTHSANGILFNGTNGWADTSGYNFSIDYFGCYTRNASDNGKDYMGSQNSELIDDGDGPYFVYINGFQLARDAFILSSRNGFGPTNNIISTGLSVVTKKASSGQSVYYKNGIQRGTANNPVFTSVAFPPIAIGALNPNSDLSAGTVGIEGYSNQQIAFAFIGNSPSNIPNRIKQTSMIQVAILTETQKEQLVGQQYAPDSYFNPIQDEDNNWIISIEETQSTDIQWVKELPLIDFKPKPSPVRTP
jgi:hypothetical protein